MPDVQEPQTVNAADSVERQLIAEALHWRHQSKRGYGDAFPTFKSLLAALRGWCRDNAVSPKMLARSIPRGRYSITERHLRNILSPDYASRLGEVKAWALVYSRKLPRPLKFGFAVYALERRQR